jgi:hypothetical protein
MSQRSVVPALILALCCGLGACSSPAKASDTTKSPGTTVTTGTPATTAPTDSTSTTQKVALTGPSVSQIETEKTVQVGGRTVTVPIDGNKPINASVDDGQEIVISAAGFLPARLYSNPGEAIVWTNLTDQPQKVMFNAFVVASPVIPAGGTWSWKTQNSESIAYRSDSGLSAVVTVLPPGL